MKAIQTNADRIRAMPGWVYRLLYGWYESAGSSVRKMAEVQATLPERL